jgi:hypothetical protein
VWCIWPTACLRPGSDWCPWQPGAWPVSDTAQDIPVSWPCLPADVKKEGPSFEPSIAIGMVAANEQTETGQLENFMIDLLARQPEG